MANRPVGKLGPVPLVRGLGFWTPQNFPGGPDLIHQLLPFDWGVPYGPPPMLQTWTWGLNQNFAPVAPPDTTHMLLPFDWGVPFGPQPLLQTWTFASRALLAPAGPAGEQVFDLAPIAPLQILPRSWTWNYNLNLIGKDQLPAGVQPGEAVFDLVPRPYPPPGLTWIQSFELNVFQQLPAGVEVFDLSPRPFPEPATRTWTFAFNPNLIGKDRFPPGTEVFDLTPKPYEFSNLFRTWAFSRNLNLIAQDALVTGEQIFDLPPIGLPYPISLRTWIAYSPLTFIPAAAPFNQDDWPIPGRFTPIDQTWARSFNLNLIGQDVLTVGEQVSDLVPRPYPEPATRTWTAWYNLNLIARDRLIVGKQSYDLTPIAPPQILPRSWTWSYNLNLTGQDQLPIGDRVYDLSPIGPFYSTQLRTWIAFAQIIPGVPFSQDDWPNPKPYPEPATRTWAWNYNLNLIAQDALVVGKQVTDLAPAGFIYPAQLRTWIDKPLLPLYFIAAQLPFNQDDWPVPVPPPPPSRFYSFSFPPTLISQDAMIIGKQVYDLAPRPYAEPATRTWAFSLFLALGPRPAGKQVYDLTTPLPPASIQLRTWSWSANLNLRGQDQLPTGDQVTDLSPRDFLRLGQLRVWYERYNLNLIGQDKLPTGDQYYDFPRPPLQPTSIFVASYNRNLIGKDQLPTGDQYYDLSPRGPITPRDIINWISSVNLALTVPPAPPPNLIVRPSDWVGDMEGPVYPVSLRTYNTTSNLCIGIPVTPPVPVAPPPPKFVFNPGNEWQIYDRIREPGPVGWR